MEVIDQLKSVYYRFIQQQLESTFQLGFVFHTEKIYNETVFNSLVAFCEAYRAITSKRAVCTIMTPENPKIKKEMLRYRVSEDEFTIRLQKLNETADIGYHGHFWKNANESFEDEKNQIKVANFNSTDEKIISHQVVKELAWLRSREFEPISYAAGWWFTNPFLTKLLTSVGIQIDYSFAHLLWTTNGWAREFMKNNSIHFGEPFYSDNAKLLHVQTLVGYPSTGHVQDVVRNLNRYLSSTRTVAGVIVTHDYNIATQQSPQATISIIRQLVKNPKVEFLSQQEFLSSFPTQSTHSTQLI